ncbi:MAG: NAD(P)/FAD-dependent oxidoreductase [Blastocatellia bacterium]|nr:NAD(P)/FAD-dependent oxidoreductase [Blastocatellia bacterium]
MSSVLADTQTPATCFDVVIVGAGVAGLTAAALLQKSGYRTLLLEGHDKAGGCAGYFYHQGYNFDVGATVLMGLDPDGLHTWVYRELGVSAPESTLIETVPVWLPDRTVTIHFDQTKWQSERVTAFARTPEEARRLADFWQQVDTTADVLWRMTAKRPVFPLRGVNDVVSNLNLLSPEMVKLVPVMFRTVEDVLVKYGLADHLPLRAFLDGLLLITAQETTAQAPFLNGAAGLDIYRHGIRRAKGGMKTLVKSLLEPYRKAGGTVQWRHWVTDITPQPGGGFTLRTSRGLEVTARRVVANLPVWNIPAIVKAELNGKLAAALKKAGLGWGAFTLYLGVDETILPAGMALNAQVLQSYREPFKDGNSCFLSLCEAGDRLSAPAGKRTLTVSTHTEVSDWKGLTSTAYEQKKQAVTNTMLEAVRRVIPQIDQGLEVILPGTPKTFERFTGRADGMVGGLRTRLDNSNWAAISSDIGLENFWLVGDTTFPGQGTMSCALSGINAWRDILTRK